jgi:hypothetical protein
MKGERMFNRKPKNASELDEVINSALFELRRLDVESKEYATAMAHVSTLYKLREQSSSKRVSPDTWVTAGASILGILAILHYERASVVSSKAIGFVQKAR